MTDANVTIAPVGGTWVVRAGGAVIAETRRALALREDGAAPVIYFPREDVGMAFLDASDTEGQDPRLGPARRFHIAAKSGPIRNAAWSYETPPADAGAIASMIAFDTAKATVEQI